MESIALAAPGWFPDPGGSTSERWWSGDAWTEHTRQPLGDTMPEAFAAHVATLVEERAEPEETSFVFGLTPSDAAPAEPARPEEAPAAAPARPPVPAALLERATATPVMTVPVPDPQPSLHLPMAPEPTAVATASAPAAPPAPAMPFAPATPPAPAAEPGFAMPSFAEPTAPAAGSGFAMPSFADPVTPMPAAAEAAGFVMPNLNALTAPDTDAPSTSGRHADAPVPVPEAPKLEVKPAAAPVGFTSSADPEIANRYRQVIHTPETPAGDAQAGLPLGAPLAPPAQPGWAGMPLPPGAPAGFGGAPGYAPTPSYAPTGGFAPTGSNKAAKLALSTGISSLAALALIFFGRILIVSSVLALVAIIAGIVGLVMARRAGVGKWSALGGLLMGLATTIAVGVSIVMAVVSAFQVDTAELEQQIVAESGQYYAVDVVSATCPAEVSILTDQSFTCTAVDSSGSVYPVNVTVASDGYLEWDLVV